MTARSSHRRPRMTRGEIARWLVRGVGLMVLATLGWIAFLLITWGIAELVLLFVPHHH